MIVRKSQEASGKCEREKNHGARAVNTTIKAAPRHHSCISTIMDARFRRSSPFDKDKIVSRQTVWQKKSRLPNNPLRIISIQFLPV